MWTTSWDKGETIRERESDILQVEIDYNSHASSDIDFEAII